MRATLPCLVLLLPSVSTAQLERARHRDPRVGGPEPRELAGKPLDRYPRFQFTRCFNVGEPVWAGVDVLRDKELAGKTVDLYLLPHERLGQALAGTALAELGGPPLTRTCADGCIQDNAFLLDAGTLAATGAPDAQGTWILGRGYDVVLDADRDGVLDAGDLCDGSPEEPGFTVVEDFVSFKREGTKETGPYPVTEVLYDGAGSSQLRQDIYYPSEIAALGELPLVVVSHGNGHNYQWYDHIGYHLASWGYVVMSHFNLTGPGIESASGTTLSNTDHLLTHLDTIAGGALLGHLDGHRIVWIGHSRGGEGVVRAYRRLLEGTPLATAYGPADIRLVSSIAPTDFLGPGTSDVGSVPYHLWTGGADADVNGCANCDICQTFHLVERADGTRFSTSLHGAGHGDFHDGGGSSVAKGPCRIGRARTHAIMRAYLLPLVQFVVHDDRPLLDYLTRQWEEFHALSAPSVDEFEPGCTVSVDLMYLPGPERDPRVVDDFQSAPEASRSSSGGLVRRSQGLEASYLEGRLDDLNASFSPVAGDFMNGMTLAGPGDTSSGCVLEWNGTNEWLMFEVPAGQRDLGGLKTLSFRAAQQTRTAPTDAELGDLDFTVRLTDASFHSSLIRIGAYGGGIEEPYQRQGCGSGAGWANEFESVRIPLDDFLRGGVALDLSRILAVTFFFGPTYGSPVGRIGLDEIEFTRD